LKATNVDFQIVAAIDINPTALKLYSANFSGTPTFSRNIKSLSAKELNELKLDAILMSPPCQPFCRTGHQLDLSDARSDPLAHLLNVLRDVHFTHLFLENVKGFEVSKAREELLELLKEKEFFVKERMLTPLDFGVPNSRLRYYLIGRKSQSFKKELETSEEETMDRRAIKDYLEEDTDSFPKDERFLKYTSLDLVTPDSLRSCCFTKAYSRYFKATSGSILSVNGKLRLFTPREVSRLLCYPEVLDFGSLRDKELYSVLGNSVNVLVCTQMLKVLFSDDPT